MNQINYCYNYHGFHIDRLIVRGDDASLRVLPPHIHNRAELLLVEHGSSTMIANDGVHHASGRYIVYVPSGCIHEQINEYSDDYYLRYCFAVTPEDFGLSEYIFPEAPFMLELDERQFEAVRTIIHALYRLHRLCDDPPSDADLYRRKHLLLMFQNELKPLLVKHFAEIPPETRELNSGCIGRICLEINTLYAEKLSLDELAARYFISRSKLTRDFRAAMNMSVGDYLTAVRINKSIPYLLDGMPIAEIAVSCGFSSASHYIRCFKQWSNQTPAKYRKNCGYMADKTR